MACWLRSSVSPFIIISLIAIVEAIRGHRPRRHIFAALFGLFVGTVLVVYVRSAQTNLGELIGVAMVVFAIRDRPHRGDERWGEHWRVRSRSRRPAS